MVGVMIMNSSKLALFGSSFLLATCVISTPAQSQSPDFQLRLESRANELDLVVAGNHASGAFLVYQGSTLEELARAPSLVIHTNTPLTAGIRFLLTTTQNPTNQAFYRAVHYTNMAYIPPGTFTMGSPESEPARLPAEGPQTQVTITRGFLMGKFEVTQAEFLNVMGTNPSGFAGNLSLPVETVSWNDAVAYCAALTTKERNGGQLPPGFAYRLPTEAEWEYACRGGATTAFHYGAALRSGMANFNGLNEYPPCGGDTYVCNNPSGVYMGGTTNVGSFPSNAWGLHDMHGNVWEWCHDWFAEELPGGNISDPQGPEEGDVRMIRGGSWDDNAWGCRSANRFYIYPDGRSNSIGFRVVLAPNPL